MSRITVAPINPDDILLPLEGTLTLFIDEADGAMKYKNDQGDIIPIGGGGSTDIIFEQTSVQLGDEISFTSLDFGTEVDIIEFGITELTRGDNGGLYNSALEPFFQFTSPAGTEWNSVFTDPLKNGHGDLSDVANRTYGTFTAALLNSIGFYILSTPLVMHDLNTDKYWKFTFTQWTAGGGGGFAYTRQEIIPADLRGITFSDGTRQTTASPTLVAGENIQFNDTTDPQGNLIREIVGAFDLKFGGTGTYEQIAFVDSTIGNDSTAELGNLSKPWASIDLAAVQSPSNFVVVLRGDYYGTINLRDNTHYHFMEGVYFGSGSRLRDGGVTINVKVTGSAIIGSFSYGFEFTGTGTRADITVAEFQDVRQVCWLVGSGQTAVVKARRITTNNNNGAGMACRIINGANLTIIASEYCESRHWFGAVAASATQDQNYFTLKCPDVRVSNTDTFGNAYKSLFNDQGFAPCIWTLDLMGGKFTHENTNVTSSFGVEDGALMIYVNVSAAEAGSKFIFKNGEFNGGVYRPIRASYIVLNGVIEVDNAVVRSTANEAVLLFHQANNSPKNIIMRARNSYFIGASANGCMQIGAGNNVFLDNCVLYANNIASTQIIKYNASNTGGGAPNVYMYNCNLELEDNGNGKLTDDALGVMQFHIVNTHSSEPIDVGTSENWGGYTQIPGFIVPKF